MTTIPKKQTTEIARVFSSGRIVSFKKGEILQRPNETPKGVYFLSEGYVKEYTLSKDGAEHLNVVYDQGEVFSIVWVFLGITQNVYREAHTDVTLRALTPDSVRNAAETNRIFNQEVMYMFMKQIHLLGSRVENLTFNNAYDKVAYHMIHLAGRFGEPHPEGWYVRMPFRHQNVADSLSMTRETASRMIQRLSRQKYIKQDGKGHFIIRNVTELASTIGVEEVLVMWPHLVTESDNNHTK